MKPYQERVVQEKKELDEKIAALKAFCNDADKFHAANEGEQECLIEQARAMTHYSDVLGRRIEIFEATEGEGE